MVAPTVHLNGTPRERLAEGYEAAYRAVTAAIAALYACAPNGRDYYVQGPAAFGRADDEHRARIAALAQVRDDLLALYEAVEG